jgi:hypothetical protein
MDLSREHHIGQLACGTSTPHAYLLKASFLAQSLSSRQLFLNQESELPPISEIFHPNFLIGVEIGFPKYQGEIEKHNFDCIGKGDYLALVIFQRFNNADIELD